MDKSNQSTNMESPLRPVPWDELLAQLEFQRPAKNNLDDSSPLVPIPLEEMLKTLFPPQNNPSKINNSGVKQKAVTFKVPKKSSLGVNNNKGIASFKNSSAQIKNSRATSIYSKVEDIHKKLSPVKTKQNVRKVLFSVVETPSVPSTRSSKSKISVLSGALRNKAQKQTPNTVTIGTTHVVNTKVILSTRKLSPAPSKRGTPLKLSSGSIEDFEQAEAFCGLQSPFSPRIKNKNWHHMIKLQTKCTTLSAKMSALSAEMSALSTDMGVLSTEISEEWQKILASFNTASNNPIGKRVRSPFVRVASAKKINLFKSTLLKTVREMPLSEELIELEATKDDDVKAKSVDLKMTQSISMYNALRQTDLLRTPKESRRSLEGEDSISTTVQKQCLLLMDTPKLSNF